jgi:hypothetical protein
VKGVDAHLECFAGECETVYTALETYYKPISDEEWNAFCNEYNEAKHAAFTCADRTAALAGLEAFLLVRNGLDE